MSKLAEELEMIARTLPDVVSKETCNTINNASVYINELEQNVNLKADFIEGTINDSATDYQRIKELEEENEKLKRALDLYERERARFRHTHPELTGEYFLSGGHGTRDSNLLPQFVTIVPAYGCAWEQVYERTDRTISYEGS